MANKNYYDILGVDKNAKEDDIRKAYRKMALKYHPDKQNGKTDAEKKEAEEKFKECSEAYETLSDNDKRQYYDRFGTSPDNQNRSGFGGFGQGFDPREFFRSHMQGFGGFSGFGEFGDFPGFDFGCRQSSKANNQNSAKNGETLRLHTSVKLEDILYGSKKRFSIAIEDPCDHCHGTGSEDGKFQTCPTCGGSGMHMQRHGMMMVGNVCQTCEGSGHIITKPCHKCNGTGTVQNNRNLEIEIQKGLSDGSIIVLKGEGQKGMNGGADGDIIITVTTEKHELFERDGNDLLVKVTIPDIVAILGGDVDIPTPWGFQKLTIPSGTQNEKAFRLDGMGVHTSNKNGDMYVIVEIETSENLTEEQRKSLEEISKNMNEKNSPKTSRQKTKFAECIKRLEKLNKKN